MTAGPTTMVFYIMGTSEFGFVVGDNDGPVFNNMPPTFFTNNGGSGDRIDVWETTPDFAVPRSIIEHIQLTLQSSRRAISSRDSHISGSRRMLVRRPDTLTLRLMSMKKASHFFTMTSEIITYYNNYNMQEMQQFAFTTFTGLYQNSNNLQ